MHKGSWFAEQLVRVSAEVVSLSLNEVGWKGLQPSDEEREGEGSWVENGRCVEESERRSLVVMGDVWGSVKGRERVWEEVC